MEQPWGNTFTGNLNANGVPQAVSCEAGYRDIEAVHDLKFYFATPHHSWERGTNENTNGLIRQYIPKGTSMKDLTQKQCDWIADELNHRPRERYGFRTPAELFL